MTEVASDTASNFSAASLVEQVLASSGTEDILYYRLIRL